MRTISAEQIYPDGIAATYQRRGGRSLGLLTLFLKVGKGYWASWLFSVEVPLRSW